MATEVYLVRHGETMFNQLDKVQGWVRFSSNREGD